jgi:hypothetical protein
VVLSVSIASDQFDEEDYIRELTDFELPRRENKPRFPKGAVFYATI